MTSLILARQVKIGEQPAIYQKKDGTSKSVWQELVGKTIKNYQGYTISFKSMEEVCTVEKDSVIRENVPFIVLADYVGESKKLENSRLLIFDLCSRHVILGESGIKGGMWEQVEQRMENLSLTCNKPYIN